VKTHATEQYGFDSFGNLLPKTITAGSGSSVAKRRVAALPRRPGPAKNWKSLTCSGLRPEHVY
jgi:hypothetical protein